MIGNLFSGVMFYNMLFFILILILFIYMTNLNIKLLITKNYKRTKAKVLSRDADITRRKEQLMRVGAGDKGWRKKYRELLQMVISAFRIKGLSPENFSTILVAITLVVSLFIIIYFDSVFVGIMLSIPIFFALFSVVLYSTKLVLAKNENAIMDALDTICPAITNSVTFAIEQNLDSYDPNIRYEFAEFLYLQKHSNYHFTDAIILLNQRLGPVLNSFAEKAIQFNELGEEGMHEIFQDVVEQNSVRREMNAEAEYRSKKFMKDLLMTQAVLLGFLGFLYIAPLSSAYISGTFIGKFVTIFAISVGLITIAINLITQITNDDRRVT